LTSIMPAVHLKLLHGWGLIPAPLSWDRPLAF
jgi:hypothetical protein